VAADIAAQYGTLSQVEAVALGGSWASGTAEPGSDIDLYVYTVAEIPVEVRAELVQARATYAEVDNQFWEPGDEWIEAETGIHVDVMFRSTAWIENQLDRVLRRYEASIGYSTCLWHNVAFSKALYDRNGWFATLQHTAQQPYPEALRRAIIAKNYPILRQTASSYQYQLKHAVAREDWVSVNHRVAALLASYFDILFAVNRKLHPGEKRLVKMAQAQCERLPIGMGRQVRALVRTVCQDPCPVIDKADALLDSLDDLLNVEGLLTPEGHLVGVGSSD
jgi:hypothetical protein